MENIVVNTTDCAGNSVFWIWIMWLVLAFVLGAIFGYILKKCKQESLLNVSDTIETKEKKFDDLTKIEGIGDKIQDLLYTAKITSYADLARASHETLRSIIHDAGPAFTMHRPITWSAQARLAEEEEWDELEKWQELLKGGI
jgi:hypothetical protein